MRQVLELSIFYFLKKRILRGLVTGLFVVGNTVYAKTSPKISMRPSAINSTLPSLKFLEQAEDIEREAWWIITNKRLDGISSPFRVFRVATLDTKKQQISFKFCRSLLVFEQGPQTWRIESACQKPSIEIGVVQRLASNPERWKISWKTNPFSDHFGLSTSILYNQQSCEIDLDGKGRISRMSCPHYVRDRKLTEIVEFNIFDYNANADKILKLEGNVKKELLEIATFNTDVPLTGDIVLKVKKVPQKSVEEKTEFSNIVPPVQTGGDSHGKNENPKSNQTVIEKDGKKTGVESKPEDENTQENRAKAYEEYEKKRQLEKNNYSVSEDKNDIGPEQDRRIDEGRNQENSKSNAYQNNDGPAQESSPEHGTSSPVPPIESVPPPTR